MKKITFKPQAIKDLSEKSNLKSKIGYLQILPVAIKPSSYYFFEGSFLAATALS